MVDDIDNVSAFAVPESVWGELHEIGRAVAARDQA